MQVLIFSESSLKMPIYDSKNRGFEDLTLYMGRAALSTVDLP